MKFFGRLRNLKDTEKEMAEIEYEIKKSTPVEALSNAWSVPVTLETVETVIGWKRLVEIKCVPTNCRLLFH